MSVVGSMRALGLMLAVVALGPAAYADAGPSSERDHERESGWHRVVGILQYLQTDYPAAVQTHDPLELEEQKALVGEAQSALRTLEPSARPFEKPLEQVAERIRHADDPVAVQQQLSILVEQMAVTGHLARAPRAPPDLVRGQTLFQAQCSTCHGMQGHGDGPAAAGLTPRPADFQGERAGQLTPYQIFNTLAFGIPKTAMVPFPGLSEDDRWSVAFFVNSLREPPCTGTHPAVGLSELSNSSDVQLTARYGAPAVACLRRDVKPADAQAGLQQARQQIAQARSLAQHGNWNEARQAVVDGYLENIEPIEPRLRAKAPDLVPRMEAAFLRTRVAAERDHGDFDGASGALLSNLDALDSATSTSSGVARFTSVFWLAMMVLVREGFEAVIVVAALLAVLKKMEQESLARVVHAGWTLALVAGAISYVLGQRLLAGANREWMEGVVALIAVAMLLYAAFWLNARVNISRYMGELRSKLQGALGRGSAAGLFFIAFSSVFRECFEAALFLQGLSIDSPKGALWGAIAGLGAMAVIVLVIRRIGFRLPMKPLFRASTILLFVTAVILLGKGIHSLQEVAALPLRPVPFFTIEPLGIFPDAVSLIPQLLLAMAPLAWKVLSPRPPTSSTPRVSAS